LPRVISFSCENFTTKEKAKEVEHFFGEHKVQGTERTVAQSIESILSNAQILERSEGAVTDWLKGYL